MLNNDTLELIKRSRMLDQLLTENRLLKESNRGLIEENSKLKEKLKPADEFCKQERN